MSATIIMDEEDAVSQALDAYIAQGKAEQEAFRRNPELRAAYERIERREAAARREGQ